MAQEEKILIISPTIPAYDRTAGEYRIFHIAKILTQKYSVFFLPLIFGGHKNKYFTDLQKNGVKIVVLPSVNLGRRNGEGGRRKEEGKENMPHSSNLEYLVKRENFKIVLYEFCHSEIDYLSIVKRYPNAKTVIDSHCLNFIENEKMSKIFSPEKIKQAKKNEISIYEKADKVITVTEREKKILRKYVNTSIETLPTGTKIPDEIRGRKGRKNIVFVGYMQNLQNEDAVIYFVKDIFPGIKKEIQEVKFYIVGSSPTKNVSRLNNKDIVVTGFVEDVTLFFSSFLVSVVPLRIGSGMKSKIIESLAWGCPVVSTSVGAEGMQLKDKKDILISNNPGKFSEKVIELYRDGKKWNSLSVNGYQAAMEKYSIERMKIRLLRIV